MLLLNRIQNIDLLRIGMTANSGIPAIVKRLEDYSCNKANGITSQ